MPTMAFKLTVEMDDGSTHFVVADQRDYAHLETQPGADVGVHTRARFLAWSAMTREGATSLPFEAFNLTHCVEVEAANSESEGEEGLDPGPRATSGDNSSS
jgi:hypothetical protein